MAAKTNKRREAMGRIELNVVAVFCKGKDSSAMAPLVPAAVPLGITLELPETTLAEDIQRMRKWFLERPELLKRSVRAFRSWADARWGKNE